MLFAKFVQCSDRSTFYLHAIHISLYILNIFITNLLKVTVDLDLDSSYLFMKYNLQFAWFIDMLNQQMYCTNFEKMTRKSKNKIKMHCHHHHCILMIYTCLLTTSIIEIQDLYQIEIRMMFLLSNDVRFDVKKCFLQKISTV